MDRATVEGDLRAHRVDRSNGAAIPDGSDISGLGGTVIPSPGSIHSLGFGGGRVSAQMCYGQSLIERLPKLGEVFAAGLVDFRVIAAAIFRTDLITDAEVLAEIDEQLARKAPSWNKLSREKVTELVDWVVIELDPEAVRVAKQRDLDRHFEVRPKQNGMAEIWGEVRGPDAAAFDAKLNALAATVCRRIRVPRPSAALMR